MNNFYERSKLFQWSVAVLLMIIMLFITYLWFKLTSVSPFFTLLILLLAPLFQFCITPFFSLLGVYKYLSPMLLIFSPNSKKYDLHNGTSFDYLLVMRKYQKGRILRQKMLEYFIEGLLKIVDEVENETISKEIEISGSSYFFSERTATRLGFELTKSSSAAKTNIVLNYLDLLWMYSLAKGKIACPDLSNIKTATNSGERLYENKHV